MAGWVNEKSTWIDRAKGTLRIAENVYGATVESPFPFSNSDVDFFKRPLPAIEDEIAALVACKGANKQVVDAVVYKVLRDYRRRNWRQRIKPFFVILLWRLTSYTNDAVLAKRR